MLIAYQQRTRLLLGDEMFKWLRDGDLTNYINEARVQVSGEGECIRATATLSLTPSVQLYSFASLVTNANYPTVITIRSGRVIGQVAPLSIRPWEWFAAYFLGLPAPVGIPTTVAQQGQGTSGSLGFWPIPGSALQVIFDSVCLPTLLIDDTTVEAIPEIWTTAVPFYAAWIAMITHPAPQIDPDTMLNRYKEIMRFARLSATPSELPSSMPVDRPLQQAG